MVIIPPLERRQGGKATEHNVNKCIQVLYSTIGMRVLLGRKGQT